jgi:signal transduction histidine kinase
MVLAGGVMALVEIVAFALLFVAIMGLRDAGRVASRSEAVLASAHRLEKSVLTLEMQSRGFLLTKDQRFLRSYNGARAVFPGQAADLERTSAADNADQGRRARHIVQADDSYLRDYSIPLMSTARNNFAAAWSRVVSGEGLKRLVPLRAQFDRFEDAQRKIAAAGTQHSVGAARGASITAEAAATGSLLLIVFFITYLTRAVVRPVRRASVMAGELAQGDLAMRMPETSPGEIGVLESMFNTMAGSLETSRDKLRQVAEEQGALRRVATLVARGVAPSEVFAAVAAEVGRVLGVEHTHIVRFEAGDTASTVALWSDPRVPSLMPPPDGHWPIEDGTVAAVCRTGQPARKTDFEPTSVIGAWVRSQGIRYVVSCPVRVEGRIWGAMLTYSLKAELEAALTEGYMLDFVELVGTAIANAQGRSDLLASRARVVAAADESRRRIERNLHDGAQQLLVTLGLKLRAAQTAVAPCQEHLEEQLASTVQGLTCVLEDLREISHGLDPIALTRNGLPPALRGLARRSTVPVELDIRLGRRLPEPIEVAIYYTVSEALTNVAKYAHASAVDLHLTVEDTTIRLSVQDDGTGGAHLSGGSGLIGLKDRIEALDGTIQLISPTGGGTSLLVDIPTEHTAVRQRHQDA